MKWIIIPYYFVDWIVRWRLWLNEYPQIILFLRRCPKDLSSRVTWSCLPPFLISFLPFLNSFFPPFRNILPPFRNTPLTANKANDDPLPLTDCTFLVYSKALTEPSEKESDDSRSCWCAAACVDLFAFLM